MSIKFNVAELKMIIFIYFLKFEIKMYQNLEHKRILILRQSLRTTNIFKAN